VTDPSTRNPDAPLEPEGGPPDERRLHPRTDRTDWESIALLRVAGRVQSLTAGSAAGPAPGDASEFGWEESVLRQLSQRLKDRGPA
jgi:hypothetical protein